jgi:hypothetical protein
VAEQDELSILENAESVPEPRRVWLGGAVAAVLLVGLAMAVLALGVLALWGASLLLSWFGVPHEPIR